MATSNDKVYVEIIAKTSEAVKSMAKFAKQIGATYLSWKAFKALVVDSVKEYMKAEAAATKLAAAMRGSGEYTKYALERMKDLSSQLQDVTRFEDDATQSAMAMLMSLGGLSSKMASNIIPNVQDFASAMGMDLESAASLVAKAIEGNVGALSRYGIKIEEGLDKEGRMAAITEKLGEKFGGLARAMGDTAGGAVIRLGNAFGDMKEEIGRATLTSLKPLVSWLTEVATKITSVMKASNDLKEALTNISKGVADTNDYLIKAQGEYNAIRSKISQVDDAMKSGTNAQALMSEAIYKGFKGLEDYRKALEKQAIAARTRSNALESQAQREAEAAEAEAERARKIQEFQDKLATAYGKTEDGQKVALAAEIAYWENALKYATSGKDKITAVLDDLKKKYEEMIPDIVASGKGGSKGKKKRDVGRGADSGYGQIEAINGQLKAYNGVIDALGVIAGEMGDIKVETEKTAETVEADWVGAFETIAGLTVDIAETMGAAFASGDILGGLNAVAQKLMSMFSMMALEAAFGAARDGLWPLALGFLAIAGVTAFTGGVLGAGKGKASEGVEVPRMAAGGVVTRPTLALIGEAGPEAVVPLGRGGAGGTTIIVEGSIWQTEDLARAVAGAMGRW